MRFPTHPGGLASVTISVPSIEAALPFWKGLLVPLGYGRIFTSNTFVVFARDGAQFCIFQSDEPTQNVWVILNARSRLEVDAVHAVAVSNNWSILQPPKAGHIAPGYYDCVLHPPTQRSVKICVAHAWHDLPPREDARGVKIPGADPGVVLSGYLYLSHKPDAAAVIVLGGYGTNAHDMTFAGPILQQEGWHALILSQRGWLGSTGDEDQGFRQQHDLVAASDWLAQETGTQRIGYLGYSQGGQVALLAAALGQRPRVVVAYYPPTDLNSLGQANKGIGDYLEDFVPHERRSGCSPVSVADRIISPTLLIHVPLR